MIQDNFEKVNLNNRRKMTLSSGTHCDETHMQEFTKTFEITHKGNCKMYIYIQWKRFLS